MASHPILPPGNPSANIAESPDFAVDLPAGRHPVGAVHLGRDRRRPTAARAHEGLGAMVLPSDFAALTPAEQLFVLTDIERVDRGLPPVVGMVAQLDTDAQNAAAANTDPDPVVGAARGPP